MSHLLAHPVTKGSVRVAVVGLPVSALLAFGLRACNLVPQCTVQVPQLGRNGTVRVATQLPKPAAPSSWLLVAFQTVAVLAARCRGVLSARCPASLSYYDRFKLGASAFVDTFRLWMYCIPGRPRTPSPLACLACIKHHVTPCDPCDVHEHQPGTARYGSAGVGDTRSVAGHGSSLA